MPKPEIQTEFFYCHKCGKNSIFKICPCYFEANTLIPVEDMYDFPDPDLAFEFKMAWRLWYEQDERTFMLAVHHYLNHALGYHYYLPEQMTAEIAMRQIRYLERICHFLQLHRETIFEGREDRVNVHTLVDPIRLVNQMIEEAAQALKRA